MNGPNLRDAVGQSIAYSHNFATAKPDIGKTEKEHILGLCALLQKCAAGVTGLLAKYTVRRDNWARLAHVSEWHSAHYKQTSDIVDDLTALSPRESFQTGVTAWMGECFPPSIVHDRTERGDRLLEEVLELLQAHGYDRIRVATLVDYVYGRPVGDPPQEVGGVMVTLAAYCMVTGLDMHAEGDRELARVTQPEVMAKIRRKQEAKNALHFDTPLPGDAPEVPRG